MNAECTRRRKVSGGEPSHVAIENCHRTFFFWDSVSHFVVFVPLLPPPAARVVSLRDRPSDGFSCENGVGLPPPLSLLNFFQATNDSSFQHNIQKLTKHLVGLCVASNENFLPRVPSFRLNPASAFEQPALHFRGMTHFACPVPQTFYRFAHRISRPFYRSMGYRPSERV